MFLQKLMHSPEDILCLGENTIITHCVNKIELGGEFTVCGRAIPDARLSIEGWERIGPEFEGSIDECDCTSCRRIIEYYKRLK